MLRRVIEPNVCREMEFIGRTLEFDHGNAVSKNVMDPSNPPRLGVHGQGVVQKSLIETVTRSEHQPVLAKPPGRL
ncbi:hypothetical protein X740_05605 [Mesorhizobium sp. LNHC221B00]|nr:hypothetical protein X740_05605 [Mesorhizobium sp. LNHC221B00]